MKAADRPDWPVVLTIAGSDSGGGAGVQADLKTFSALRAFGVTAFTCLTAQNPDSVDAVFDVPPAMVVRQIDSICGGFTVAAAKTGMLHTAAVVRAVARVAAARRFPALVVDPVMVATSGAALLRDDAIAALQRDLLPLATVITPNADEAAILVGRRVECLRGQRAAAKAIAARFGAACVVKGGHVGRGGEIVNVLCAGGAITEHPCERVAGAATHGTGCTFSAALAALLARGRTLDCAVEQAGRFVSRAVRNAIRAGRHRPLNPFSAS